MKIDLNLVQIYTNKATSGNFYYNITAITESGKKFSISSSVLFINTLDMTVFLNDDFEHKVWDYQTKKNLSKANAKKFLAQLTAGEHIVHNKDKKHNEDAGHDEPDDVPF